MPRPITREAISAYRKKDGTALHVALDLRPWEISPLALHLNPKPSPEILHGRDRIWWSSWAQADRLRKELEAAIANDHHG
jgi:hypothetical protein